MRVPLGAAAKGLSVTRPDGNSETCQVLNISASGAALCADTAPEIGTVLIVGKIVSHVVRQFDGGFAVQFIERQPVVAGSKVRAP